MGCKNTVLFVLVATLITKEALAAKHVVGGSQGWDPSTDFNSWVSGQTFKVGDQLVFKYSSLHSVVELGSESAYKKCDISNTMKSLSSGNDVVKLDKPGTRYFTCGTSGHCGQGMKMKITIGKGNALSSSPAPSPSSSSSSSSSSSPSSSSSSSSSQSPSASSSTTSTSAASASRCFANFVLIVALLVASATMF